MHGILISLSRLQPFSVPPSSSSSIWNRALPLFLSSLLRQLVVFLSLALSLFLSVPLRSSTPRGASSANETSVSYRRLVPPAFTVELLWNYLRDFTEKPSKSFDDRVDFDRIASLRFVRYIYIYLYLYGLILFVSFMGKDIIILIDR